MPRVGPDQRVHCRITGRAVLEQYLGAAVQIDPRLALPDDRQLAFEHVTPDLAVESTRGPWRNRPLAVAVTP
jgi:hypothetical protein